MMIDQFVIKHMCNLQFRMMRSSICYSKTMKNRVEQITFEYIWHTAYQWSISHNEIKKQTSKRCGCTVPYALRNKSLTHL